MPESPRATTLPPNSTVTLMFTDIEGSTVLWEKDGARMARALAAHDALARRAVESNRGTLVKTTGDGLHAAFDDPLDALAATVDLQQALADPAATCGVPMSVRCGLHAGAVERRNDDYFGGSVNRAARIMKAAHGGQVLLSQAVVDRVRETLPESISLRDLGKVRLKDLATPEHVYQVMHPRLRRDFPALRSLEATPNNLPRQATRFIGRENELVQLRRLLENSCTLTLTGSGGSGKTRLGLQVAAESLERFPDGVWVAELASLARTGSVPRAVATVLGLREVPGKPILQTLTEHLKDKRVLLLLDNCEHLLDGCAQLSDTLVRCCPNLTILATSREPLRIDGEQSYRVPSLSLPDPKVAHTPASVAPFEAVQLFADRARLVRLDFEVTEHSATSIVSICHRLDGIPLAIELAAARVRSLSTEEINQRLDQRFRFFEEGSRAALPRQQTLRSLIDWSYDLLNSPERPLLQRLSVFAGGWTLEAAESVCVEASEARGRVVHLLTSLADKSLVLAEETSGRVRYRLLETVREYAHEKLRESGEDNTFRRRHRDYFLSLVEKEGRRPGPEQAALFQRMEDEHENLRAGLDWALMQAEAAETLKLCSSVQLFWMTRGYLAEGREWSARVLAMAGTEQFPRERAAVLNGAGLLAYYQSDHPAAATLLEECLAIERQLRDPGRVATVLGNLGLVVFEQGNLPAAQALQEEKLATVRELGNQIGIASALTNLAVILTQRGDYSSARAMLEEGLAIKRGIGDQGFIASSLGNLANLALDQGDLDGARARYDECLAIMREQGNRKYIAMALESLGRVACFQGDYPTARTHFEESLAMMRELQHGDGIALSLYGLGNVACEQEDYGAARLLFEECLTIRREREEPRGIVAALSGLATVVAARGDVLSAARLWGAVEHGRASTESQLTSNERPRYEARVAAARAAVADDATFNRAWQEGRALSLEQAIALAVENRPADDDGI